MILLAVLIGVIFVGGGLSAIIESVWHGKDRY